MTESAGLTAWLPEFHWADLPWLLRAGVEVLLLWIAVYWLLRALERISAGGKIKGISLVLVGVVAAWMAPPTRNVRCAQSTGMLFIVGAPELRRSSPRISDRECSPASGKEVHQSARGCGSPV